MPHLANTLISSLILITVLSGCSGIPVQTSRLNSVEDLLNDAERVVANKSAPNPTRYAQENLDTAGAYLLTLRDNKKTLTDMQMKRYLSLKQRISILRRRLGL